jgi:CheY-like chemotaxis protein
MDVVFSRSPVGGRQFSHDRFRHAGSMPTGVYDPTAFKMNKSPRHDMTQRHDGSIEIDSAPGRGAMPQAKQKRSIHILCIDDNALVRECLDVCLTHFDHRVMVASGGKQGMELFRTATLKNQPYEVVITDLGMPDIDGHHVARTIKAESPNTPVIMMTGWGTTTGDDGEIASEVDAVIGKPPRMQELNDLLLRITTPAQKKLKAEITLA